MKKEDVITYLSLALIIAVLTFVAYVSIKAEGPDNPTEEISLDLAKDIIEDQIK